MNNLPNWTHFSRPQHVGARSFFFGLLAGFALGLLPWERMALWLLGFLQRAGFIRLP